jgi:hypothetical protein
MKARFYDPSVGRFTSLDPLIRDPATIESVNPYSYVENNPVNNIDPDGRALSPADFLNFNRGSSVPTLPGFGTSPNGTRTSTGVFGPVTVTVTTMINIPQTRLDRALGNRDGNQALRLLGIPAPGSRVIQGIGRDLVLSGDSSGPESLGVIFADGAVDSTDIPALSDKELKVLNQAVFTAAAEIGQLSPDEFREQFPETAKLGDLEVAIIQGTLLQDLRELAIPGLQSQLLRSIAGVTDKIAREVLTLPGRLVPGGKVVLDQILQGPKTVEKTVGFFNPVTASVTCSARPAGCVAVLAR